MLDFITIESAIAELVDVLEHTPPEDRPDPWTVFLAVAEGYGEGVDLTPPWAGRSSMRNAVQNNDEPR